MIRRKPNLKKKRTAVKNLKYDILAWSQGLKG